ncbi:P-II family nitrogen regulator [Caproiciproducens faecalis]|uniref:P-II family nitrogen regulator n=1 Tax=Caproiciproducens faecalis TaxID=2820301 RepID=A0ABS7DLQ3_9FIRM|nr:P-II family nitrogen regulator [Caproiciproducens faecalis]MBW7572138.1 P-II family nitrogen regulator [Caproiciproducens faecalis]
MKKIEAFIRPEQLEDMKEILDTLQLSGLSIMQVMGCGNQKGWKEFVRGAEIDYQFLPKIKMEMIVLDEQADSVVDSIVSKAYTGEFGDGKIFISDIGDAVRIRTGERGRKAVR